MSTIGSGGGGGQSWMTSGSSTTSYTTSTAPFIGTYTTPSMSVDKLTVNGIDVGSKLQIISDRLAILDNPDPVKLEKFNALKKAYEHYKLLEKLFDDDAGENI